MKSIMRIWIPIGAAILFSLQPMEVCYPNGEILIESISISTVPGSGEREVKIAGKRDGISIEGVEGRSTLPVEVFLSYWNVEYRESPDAELVKARLKKYRVLSSDDGKTLDWSLWMPGEFMERIGVHRAPDGQGVLISVVMMTSEVRIYELGRGTTPEQSPQAYLGAERGPDFIASIDCFEVFGDKIRGSHPERNALNGSTIEVERIEKKDGRLRVELKYHDLSEEAHSIAAIQDEDGVWREAEIRE